MLNGRYVELVDGYQHYKKVEVIGKGRQQYQVGVETLAVNFLFQPTLISIF
jgi:hypothetical protein